MIGTIYKITNNINNKSYIGKTYRPINTRWNEHIRSSKYYKNRPLYKAINKYGPDNFSIESLGEYSEDILEAQEIEYISFYNTFKSGYNATEGGDSGRYLNISDKTILDYFEELKNIAEVSRVLKIDYGTVRKVLKSYNVNTNTVEKVIFVEELNKTFNSITECANFLINNNYTKNKYCRNKIYDVISGNRKSYLKFTFVVVERKQVSG